MPSARLRSAVAAIAATLILIIAPIAGMILFSYDSLTDPARGPGYLSQAGRAAFQ